MILMRMDAMIKNQYLKALICIKIFELKKNMHKDDI